MRRIFLSLLISLAFLINDATAADDLDGPAAAIAGRAGPIFYIGGAAGWTDHDVNQDLSNLFEESGFDPCRDSVIPASEPVPGACNAGFNSNSWSILAGIDNAFEIGPNLQLRLEAEYSRYNASGDLGTGFFIPEEGIAMAEHSVSIDRLNAGFANAYLEGEIAPSVSLFLGGGIGATRLDASVRTRLDDFADPLEAGPGGEFIDYTSGSASATNFAYHVGGGGRIEIARGVEIFSHVRYVDFGSISVPHYDTSSPPNRLGRSDADLTAFEVRVGVTIAVGQVPPVLP